MADKTGVILSGLADEAANQKTAVQQFAAFAALGLQYYSLRWIDVGEGIKNVMQLTTKEITQLRHLEDEYGLNVASIASPIGKIKLVDKEDGTKNTFVPFKKYLAKDVKRVCELSHAFETKLIRGFSFYPPKNEDPWKYVEQAADYLGQIAEVCHRSDLTFGLEIEANLVGQTAELLVALQKKVNHPAMVMIFDAANVLCQGYTTAQTFEQYTLLKPYIGWLHIKDYKHPKPPERVGHVDEDAIKNFVPADRGHAGHELILRDFAELVPKLHAKLHRRGIPGVFLDLEPHVKGGGQFGGFSGPDGFGVALRGLCRVLDFVGLDYHLRDFGDIQDARGF
ncbi:MAG: sugar phosphate isomerase/epimerase [Planctomycetes bacterium]|nr:sugar phosphate isomerase/epimerase [Planctomycetota bacterium]